MSENATESTESAQTTGDQNAEQAATPTIEELQAKIEELTTHSRKWEARAKENSGAAKAAEQARLDAMTESERAIEQAKQSARAEAATEYGKRLARTEFDAIAGRRNADFDTAAALEFVDLSRFLDENGEPDAKAIKAAVERLVPASDPGPAGFDGGARSTSKAPDFNQVLRQAAGRA